MFMYTKRGKYQEGRRNQILKQLARIGAFTLSDAKKLGMPHPTVLRLVNRGVLVKLEWGLYAVLGKAPDGETADFVIARKKFGNYASICGLTALFQYGLIDEVPTQIWVLVSPDVRTTNRKYRLLRTKRNLIVGVVDKGGYSITSLERSLIDALVFSSKIGERVAKQVILRALRRKMTNAKKIFTMAEKLNALDVLEKQWQSILAGVAE